ncbi:MAG: efflux RND transporter periplasmic adaptor subunit [Syntrophus sp. (in: bacteria)]|nr:efflux RND transporter periplasmic adaptor subunit [Syntrophus sp. (in: bacteria)]
MKKPLIIVVCLILVATGIVFFYSTRRGGTGNPSKNLTQAPTGQQTGSMPGMPGMPAEKPPGEPAKPAEVTQKQEEAPTVEIPLEKQQLIGVKTTVASMQPLQKIIRTVGKIEYDERKLTTVNTKVEGWIEKLYVNFTGIYVKKGERLADIYSPELWATQQEFINLVRWAKKTGKRNTDSGRTADSSGDTQNLAAMLSKDAESIIDAARQRLKLWDISDEQIKKIEESEKPVRTLAVYSPVSGYVLQKYATQGMKVMAGEKLLEVSDLSTVWIVADIYEYELPFIKVGDTARIQLSYFSGKELSSRIEFVAPTLDAQTRTAKVRFSIPNPGGQLKPQMFTDVELKVNLGQKFAVPDDAVIDTGLRKIVYVDKGDGYFEPRVVTTGLRAEKFIEVLSGLKAGEKIASAANFLIDSEAKLKGIEAKDAGSGAKQKAVAPPGGHGSH